MFMSVAWERALILSAYKAEHFALSSSCVRNLLQAGHFCGLPLLQNFGVAAATSSINNAEQRAVSARTLLVMHCIAFWLPVREHLKVPTFFIVDFNIENK